MPGRWSMPGRISSRFARRFGGKTIQRLPCPRLRSLWPADRFWSMKERAMADDKEPMQADGEGGPGRAVANENDPPGAGRPDMEANGGQSGGGAYPSPHNDPDKAEPESGFLGH